MTSEEIRKMLENAGIKGEDQQKYFTTTQKDLPGLFGINQFQTEMFQNLIGGFPQFDPTLIKEGLGKVADYGKEQTGFITGKFKTGMRDVASGLGSGLLNITQKVGKGFTRSGAKERLFGEQRDLASEASDDLRTKFDTSMSLLGEKLGQRKAAVRRGITDYRQNLFNLVQSIYAMDPASGEGGNNQKGFLQGNVDDWNFKMPDGIERRYAENQLGSYFRQNYVSYDDNEWEKYLAEFSEAYKNSGNTLSAADWWMTRQKGDS